MTKRYRLRINPVHGNGLSIWPTQVELRLTEVVVVDGPNAALSRRRRIRCCWAGRQK